MIETPGLNGQGWPAHSKVRPGLDMPQPSHTQPMNTPRFWRILHAKRNTCMLQNSEILQIKKGYLNARGTARKSLNRKSCKQTTPIIDLNMSSKVQKTNSHYKRL